MGTRERADRKTRLLLFAAVALLLGGFAVGGVTGWSWWRRVQAVHTAQQRLTRALDAQWRAGAGDFPPTTTRVAAMPFTAGQPGNTGSGATGSDGNGSDGNGSNGNGSDGNGSDTAGSGTPIARLYLPTLGVRLVVVNGVDDADLALGPGHIPGTPYFGAAGNVGVAGHRYPGLFWNLDKLQVGAPVVVETRDTWFVYRVIDASVVTPDHNEVLGEPPPGAAPRLTLVTCDPKLSTARRLIRQATLVRRDPHTGTRPAELS